MLVRENKEAYELENGLIDEDDDSEEEIRREQEIIQQLNSIASSRLVQANGPQSSKFNTNVSILRRIFRGGANE